MAIVINSKPDTYFSAHGDLIWVVYEATKANDPANYPGYRYVADVYVGGIKVAQVRKYPQPDNKRGVFNLGDIIRNYVSSAFNPGAGLRCQEIDMSATAYLSFGEEYDFTTYLDVTVDSAQKYYNHYNGSLLGEFTMLPNYLNKVLSNRPIKTPVKRDATHCFLPFFPSTTASRNITVTAYPGGNTIVQAFVPTANTVQLFNVAPDVLNSITANFINDSKQYYTVQIGTDATYRFDLVCEPRYETVTLHFLNKLGAYESKEFTKVSRKSISVTKSDFNRLPYTVGADGSVSYYNSNGVYNDNISTYSSQYTEKLSINSDLLTDAEYRWLAELIVSPLVYLEVEGYFKAVKITNNDYEYRKNINDKLTSINLTLELGEKLNGQYR